jgi:hypothetical protein
MPTQQISKQEPPVIDAQSTADPDRPLRELAIKQIEHRTLPSH